ncbi:hypothetical protein STRTUCAR8_01631 [Streptomyces turgidiscabies Car8]|uniref:Uncharacterized protein n=1 Tax=Streptomyces turgidiscabies (strain Car8) TaxID=698760 RepID=L7F4P3_STRT8|nr:hypothetical protein STRTUCAR8_01631 [Streptomyces turgidiscabies Car8]
MPAGRRTLYQRGPLRRALLDTSALTTDIIAATRRPTPASFVAGARAGTVWCLIPVHVWERCRGYWPIWARLGLLDTGDVESSITIRQVFKVWRSASSGTPRVAVLRLRYRAVGDNWGHAGGGGRGTLRISEPEVHADECAVAALCVSLAAVEPDDQVFIIAPLSVAELIQSLVQACSVTALATPLRPYVAPHLDRLASASIEVRDRRGMRDMFQQVSESRPASTFLRLDDASRAVASGIATRPGRPAPMEIGELGWVTDWGRSQHYDGAAVAFLLASGEGAREDSVRVMAVPQEPEIVDGELAAVLIAYAYGQVTGQSVQVFYTDSRDAGIRLRRYVESGRPDGYGTLLAALTAPFTDAELLDLQVYWVYRGLTRAQRLADTAARHMSRHEPVPAEAVVTADWLLQELEALSAA